MSGLSNILKIGTRGSPLALYQARLVQSLLTPQSEIIILKTSGDKIKGDLKEFGGKGLFTKELEEALIDGRIDMAVHSMKDVPTVSQPALTIAAVLEREDPRDAFISVQCGGLEDLRQGAVIGTASIRRRAQLSAIRPDISFKLLRGNVGTRLEKVIAGEFDGTFLACAGLKRLGLKEVITQSVAPEIMLPAPAQGAIGIEIRKNDENVSRFVGMLNHAPTGLAIMAERAFLSALDGSCKTPIAALATLEDGLLNFKGEALAKDGSLCMRRDGVLKNPTQQSAITMGRKLGEDIKAEAGDKILWDEGA